MIAVILGLHTSLGQASPIISNTTYYISDPGGGDCALIGTWSAPNKTCKLNTDISFIGVDGIQINSDGVTIDGNGHTLNGNNYWTNGVYATGRTGVTVKNLTVSQFGNGIYLDTSTGSNLSGNTAISNGSNAIFLGSSDFNTVYGNTLWNNGYGILLSNSNYNALIANSITANLNYGIWLNSSDNDTVTGNSITNGTCGIYVLGNSNTLSGNFVSNTNTGAYLFSADSNDVWGNTFANNYMTGIQLALAGYNTFYRNNLINNPTQAIDYGGGGGANVFTGGMPGTGNYWSDWTTPDANADGFVDNPYVFSGGQDILPLTTPYGTGKPLLKLSKPGPGNPFWASYADYLAGQLSVNWTVSNVGFNEAFSAAITGGSNTNGVIMISTMPVSLGNGNIRSGDSSTVTLKYSLPPGVSAFSASLTAADQDIIGASYTYP